MATESNPWECIDTPLIAPTPATPAAETPVNDLAAGTHGPGVYTGGVWVDADGSEYK